MKQFLFSLAIFLHCLHLNAFEYPMLKNATLRSQNSAGPLESSLDSLLEKALWRVCFIEGQNGAGTGFFISSQGHIITNAHVIEDISNFAIYLGFSEHPVQASIIAKHPTEDVALLKIDDLTNLQFSYFEISSVSEQIGDWVFCPRARGICDHDHLFVLPSLGKIIGGTTAPALTILTISSVPGNSGTPVLDLKGDVIGILTKQASINGHSTKSSGISLMTPTYTWID